MKKRFSIDWESPNSDSIVIKDRDFPHQPFAKIYNLGVQPEFQPAVENFVKNLNSVWDRKAPLQSKRSSHETTRQSN